MATQDQYNITDGPSKFDLVLALFDGKDAKVTLEGKEIVRVNINSVKAEDWKRESWVLDGYNGSVSISGKSLLNVGKFTGYYNSRTRKGWLKLIAS